MNRAPEILTVSKWGVYWTLELDPKADDMDLDHVRGIVSAKVEDPDEWDEVCCEDTYGNPDPIDWLEWTDRETELYAAAWEAYYR